MKRKIESDISCENKKQRLHKVKRSRSLSPCNRGGASDDEEDEHREIKRMLSSMRVPIVTRRYIPYKRLERDRVPSYIN